MKEIRQNFSKAVVSGSRNGSGKIVYEFYDKLITLLGGSAGTEPLSYGVGGVDLVEKDEATVLEGLRKTRKFLVWIWKVQVRQQVQVSLVPVVAMKMTLWLILRNGKLTLCRS